MVEPIGELPAGILGFRITGKLERDEYHDTLIAPLDSGSRSRCTSQPGAAHPVARLQARMATAVRTRR